MRASIREWQTSSHEEEKATLLLALDWARTNCPTECISIYSESHPLLKTIQSDAHDTQAIRHRLENREGPTTLIWVPAHKGIPGNEDRKSPHPTHNHRSPVQQVPNSHGVRRSLLESRLHRHLQQGRCRSASPPTIRARATSQGVRPPTISGSPPHVPAVQGGSASTRDAQI